MKNLFITIAVLLSIVSSNVIAQPQRPPSKDDELIRAAEASFVGYRDPASKFKLYPMHRFYGERREWYVAPSLRSVVINTHTFNSGTTASSFTIDLATLIENAFTSWGFTSSSTNPGSPYSPRNATFMPGVSRSNQTAIVIDEAQHANTGLLAYVNFPMTNQSTTPVTLSLDINAINEGMEDNYACFILDGTIDKSTTLEQWWRLYYRVVILHELGHLFGLEHPDEHIPDMEDSLHQIVPIETPSGFFHLTPGITLISSHSYDHPSIMMANINDYFVALRRHLGRPITSDDVGLGRPGRDAVSMMWNGTSQNDRVSTIQQISNNSSSSGATGSHRLDAESMVINSLHDNSILK